MTEIIHFEFQASSSAEKHRDVAAYHILLHRQYKVPVHSIVILLRPQASHSNMSGQLHYSTRPKRGKMEFVYELIRLWEVPAEFWLRGNVDLAPLAVLGKLPDGDPETALAGVVHRLVERTVKDAADRSKRLNTSAFVLSGLRVKLSSARELFKEAPSMRESVTFQAILEEGKETGTIEKAKDVIKRLGTKRFGAPEAKEMDALEAIFDRKRLDAMIDSMLDVNSWDELLNQTDVAK